MSYEQDLQHTLDSLKNINKRREDENRRLKAQAARYQTKAYVGRLGQDIVRGNERTGFIERCEKKLLSR
jgi:hypothetical protein